MTKKTNPELVDEAIERAKADPNCGWVTQEHLDKSQRFVEFVANERARSESNGPIDVFDPERAWTQFRLLLPIDHHPYVPEWGDLPSPIKRAFAKVLDDMEHWFRQFLFYYGLEKLIDSEEERTE